MSRTSHKNRHDTRNTPSGRVDERNRLLTTVVS
jgi:hypothetical protein